MDNQLTNNLLSEIKQNKKYRTISDEIVLNEINFYLNKNPIIKITKQDVKEIRNSLHKSYASFQTKKKNKIQDYLDELREMVSSNESINAKKSKTNTLLNITNNLLSITLSTKERINDYADIYKKIFTITGKPKIVIDLGAGFNVFSFPLMNLSMAEYYSYDINEQDINYLNKYYKIMKVRGLYGKAEILDVRDLRQISNLPPSDIIFIFKLIDIIDKENHKPSEELIKNLFKNKKTKFIVASFATKTITRKQMNFPNRKWFELMLERINLKFQTINTDNEIFYVIKSFNSLPTP